MREAAFLAHENEQVQQAFLAIHNEEDRSTLLDLCRRYALYHDQRAGEEAARYLKSHQAVEAASNALECLRLVLESKQSAGIDERLEAK